MSNEFPPTLTPEEIAGMEATHARFVEAVDAGQALPGDGRLGRPVSESLTPQAAAYVLGRTDKLQPFDGPEAEAEEK